MKRFLTTRVPVRAAWIAVGALALVAAGWPGASAAHRGKDGDNAYLGVYMQSLTKDVRHGLDLDVDEGVLIGGVADDSPAQKAGIEDGDVIIEFNGDSVDNPDALSRLVGGLKPGTRVKVVVVRDGKHKSLEVELGEKPDNFDSFDFNGARRFAPMMREFSKNAFFSPGPRLGVHASDLNNDLAPYFDVKGDDGVLVLDVNDGSMAARAGVKPGDVILRVGDERIDEISDIHAALEDHNEGDQVDLTVLRHGKKKKLHAKVEDAREEYSFHVRAPRMRWHGDTPPVMREYMRGGRRGEMQDLRKQIDELRKELDDLKKGLARGKS